MDDVQRVNARDLMGRWCLVRYQITLSLPCEKKVSHDHCISVQAFRISGCERCMYASLVRGENRALEGKFVRFHVPRELDQPTVNGDR